MYTVVPEVLVGEKSRNRRLEAEIMATWRSEIQKGVNLPRPSSCDVVSTGQHPRKRGFLPEDSHDGFLEQWSIRPDITAGPESGS